MRIKRMWIICVKWYAVCELGWAIANLTFIGNRQITSEQSQRWVVKSLKLETVFLTCISMDKMDIKKKIITYLDMQSMLNFSFQVFHKKSFNCVITINRCRVSFCSNRKRRIIFRSKFFTTMTLNPSTDSGWWLYCGWFFNLCKRHFVCKFLHLMSLLCPVSTQNAKKSHVTSKV